MKRCGIKAYKFALEFALATVMTSCIKDDFPQGEIIQVGDALPQFSVLMNDDTTISTADLKGNVSCIVFFSTECEDCQQTLPILNTLYLELGIGSGEMSEQQVRFVCISREQKAETVARYWEENGLSLPYSAQEDRTVYNLFAYSIVPRIYISDSGCVVRAKFDDNPVPGYNDIYNAIVEQLTH